MYNFGAYNKKTKYKVKFQHVINHFTNTSTSSNLRSEVLTIDEEWELDAWIDIFSLIQSRYNVVGSINITILPTEHRSQSYENKKGIENE